MASIRVPARDMVELARIPFFEIAPELQGSLLYLDAGAGEAAHFCLGLPFLLNLGARGVCSLEGASEADRDLALLTAGRDADHPVSSLAIFVTRPLPELLPHLRRVLSLHGGSLQSCRVYCAVTEAAHAQMHLSFPFVPQVEDNDHDHDGNNGNNAADGARAADLRYDQAAAGASSSIYRQLEALLRNHCATSPLRPPSSRHLAVHVRHFPLLWCGLSPSCFVMTPALPPAPAVRPSSGLSMSSSSSSLRTSAADGAGRGPLGAAALVPGGSIPRVDDGSPEMDDEEAPLPPALSLLGHTLAGVADQLGVKPDVFALGHTSRAVARVLSRRAQQSGQGAGADASKRPTAAFVLVDRTLDLITPSCHSDHMLDRILTAIPTCRQDASASNIGGSMPLHSSLRQPCFPEQLLPCCCQPCRRGLCEAGSPATSISKEGAAVASTGGNIASFSGAPPSSAAADADEGDRDGEGMSALARLRCAGVCHPEDNLGRSLMQRLLQAERVKESAMAVRKALLDAVKTEKLQSPATKVKLTSVSASELIDLAALLAQQPTLMLRYAPLIQIGLMAAHAMDARVAARWEALGGVEKALALAVPEGTSALATQLVDLASQTKREALAKKARRRASTLDSTSSSSSITAQGEPPTRSSNANPDARSSATARGKGGAQGDPPGQLVGIGDVLSMAAVVYGMAGRWKGARGGGGGGLGEGNGAEGNVFSWQDEFSIKDALLEAIMADPSSQMRQVPFLRGKDCHVASSGHAVSTTSNNGKGAGPATSAVEAGELSEEDLLMLRLEVKDLIDEKFEQLEALSHATSRLKDPSLVIDAAGQPQPLLRSLMARVGSKAEVPDLVHSSSGLRGLLRSGLGRFGLQVKAKPGDHQTIILFVIGGFTPSEVRQAQAGLESTNPDIELLVGGTNLQSQASIYEELFQ